MDQRIQSVLASPVDLLLLATDESNQPIAWVQAHSAHILESGYRVEIVGMLVSHLFRRTGIGRALVSAVEEWAAKLKAEAIVVRSNISRKESHPFYQALGYKPTKTQHVYRKQLSAG
jgi:GNAT superfamily N-acetyltransferase